ncbi:MAG: hypothetical protein WBA10_04770 [Elainellaceae cyanobacterium]
MPAKPLVSSRVPVQWKTEIDRLAKRTGRKPAQVVYEAIAQYLEHGDADTLTGQVERLTGRMEAMERQLAALRVLVAR